MARFVFVVLFLSFFLFSFLKVDIYVRVLYYYTTALACGSTVVAASKEVLSPAGLLWPRFLCGFIFSNFCSRRRRDQL